jgi:hypothetical protein
MAIFQHSLPFLQSESFQTHVGTIHRRAIGPLAHHNSTSAYSPSLACSSPKRSNFFTVHRINSRAPLTVSRHELNFQPKGVHSPTHKHVCTRTISKPPWTSVEFRNTIVTCLIVVSVTMLLNRPSISIVALLRKRNNVLSHCYATGCRRHATKETSHM